MVKIYILQNILKKKILTYLFEFEFVNILGKDNDSQLRRFKSVAPSYPPILPY